MQRIKVICVLLVLFVLGLAASPSPIAAQNAAIKCGDIIKGELTKEKQVQSYPIVLSPGDKATFSGQADGTSQLLFGITLDSPAGYRIFPGRNADIDMKASPFLTTGRMPGYGLYTLNVFNNDKTGSYQISIACELADGTIIPAGDTSYTPTNAGRPKTVTLPLAVIQGSSLRQLQCGDVIAAEFTQNEQIHNYTLEMAPGDISFMISVQPFGDGFQAATVILDPAGKALAAIAGAQFVESGSQRTVSPIIPGNYRILISNTKISEKGTVWNPGDQGGMGGVGIYTLVVSCTLKNNEIVAPDPSKIEQATTSVVESQAVVPTSVSSDTASALSSCPNSPAPRLEIGGKGRVTPGDANNLRDNPNGGHIGKLDAGTEFDVLEGPVCSQKGLAFWRVQAGDLTGWTAEGQGAEYWLEPVQSGRG